MKIKLKKTYTTLVLLFSMTITAAPRLLIKIPTRSRPEQFFKMLDLYYAKLSKTVPCTFVITCDTDDKKMNNKKVIKKLKKYPNLYYYFGKNTCKVEAYNADINKHNWDIVLITSDDLKPVTQDYDRIIVDNMLKYFPDFSGVLNFHDGKVGAILNTYPVIGRRFYDAFGYAYHPIYKSLACDNEITDISKILRKHKYIDICLLDHMHPAWGKGKMDALYQRNEKIGHSRDVGIYKERRKRTFDLSQDLLDAAMPKMWSILICTLEERQASFDHIYNKLQKQITDLGLQDRIEVLFFRDNRQYSVGYKRNALLEESCGKYVCFVDDDDDVSDDYIQVIYDRLQKNPDCVELKGIITFAGSNPKTFIHSVKYDSFFEKNRIYYRPPNHLSPMRRSVACQCHFPDKNSHEDSDWTIQILKTRLLTKEEAVNSPYYFYQSDGNMQKHVVR